MARHIAMILTSHTTLGESGRATGFWYEELAAPFYEFAAAGLSVGLYSVRGDPVQPDPTSVVAQAGTSPSVGRFLRDEAAQAKLGAPVALAELVGDEPAALLLVGGHGAMWDFPADGDLRTALLAMDSRDAVIAGLCHGPAGLLTARRGDGSRLVEGRRLTAFTDEEEAAIGLTQVVPFLLESELRAAGGRFESAAPFTPFAISDGNLVTGQNPQSSVLVAQFILEALGKA